MKLSFYKNMDEQQIEGKIKLDQMKLEMFYKQFGSKNFDLQHEMSKDFGEKTLDLYYKSIDFIYKTIATIGIIAGFGFTAMGYIRNDILFIVGEIFLLSAIAFGIWVIQSIYLKEKDNLDKFYGKIREHFKEWYVLFKPIFDRALKDDMTKNDLSILQKKEWELVSIFTDDSADFKEDRKDNLRAIVCVIFSLFIVGIFTLLLSFIVY